MIDFEITKAQPYEVTVAMQMLSQLLDRKLDVTQQKQLGQDTVTDDLEGPGDA